MALGYMVCGLKDHKNYQQSSNQEPYDNSLEDEHLPNNTWT